VGEREVAERLLAGVGEADEHLAAVVLAALGGDEAALLGAANQLVRRVVLQLEPLRQVTDGRQAVDGHPLHREQELVLLRLEAGLAGGPLAEVQEAADPIAQLGEDAVLGRPQVVARGGGHGRYIVPRSYRDAKYQP
jgi:hypothetical protein